jgi:hypothetical protein
VPPPEAFRADPEGQRQPSETPSETCKGQNDIAKFAFRAENTWHTGTHSRSRIHGFHGAGQELTHPHETVDDGTDCLTRSDEFVPVWRRDPGHVS